MRFSICFALFFSPSLSFSQQITSASNPQLSTPTPAPAGALARRDNLPTVTFGPASNYAVQASNAPTLTSSDLSVVKRSEATGGVDIFLGPDKQKKVQDIIEKSCPKDPNAQCIQDLAQVFDQREVGIQARQLGVVLFSAAFLALAWWLQRQLDDNPQKTVHAFLPESDVSQAASIMASSTLVFVTTANDPHPITFTSASTADTATSGLVVSTATAKGDSYDKGDVVIQVPEKLGHDVQSFVGMASQCANGQVDKTDLDCVNKVAESLIGQASQGGPFRNLVLVTATLPGLKDDLGTHLAALLKSVTQHITGLALGEDGINFLAEVAFWIVFQQLVKQNMVADQVVIPAASTTSTAPASTSSSSCPPEDRKPNCSNCGSTRKNVDKSSGFCPGPQWQGCPCVDGPSFPYSPLDKDAFAKAQSALKNIVTQFRDPAASMVKCAGGDKVSVLSSKVTDNIDAFCGKYDGQGVGDNTQQEWYDNGDGNWINFSVSKDLATCGNSNMKISKSTCSKAMNNAVGKCASGATTKGGTTGSYQCMNFGFFGADPHTAGKPFQCPDSNPLLNLAHNPCDTKCNAAGYENCSPDLAAPNDTLEDHNGPLKNVDFVKYSCFCKNTPAKTSPCAGMKCGDPIKMNTGPVNSDGSPKYPALMHTSDGRLKLTDGVPPSLYACDVGCKNGNYVCGDTDPFQTHNTCRCSDDPGPVQVCVDVIRDYGAQGR